MGFFSCEVFDDNDDSPNTSYNCINNDCFSADGGNGQYATLDDCLSVCNGSNGNNDDNNYPSATVCYEIEINSSISSKVEFWSEYYSTQETFFLTNDNTSSTINPNHCITTTYYSTTTNLVEQYNLKIEHYHNFTVGDNSATSTTAFDNISDLDFITGCFEVSIRTFVNEELYETNSFSLGCNEWGYVNNSSDFFPGNYVLSDCIVFCGTNGFEYFGATDLSNYFD